MINIKNIINDAIVATDNLYYKFSSTSNNEPWEDFLKFISQLQEIIEKLKYIINQSQENNVSSILELNNNLQKYLIELEKPIISKDYILIADIIRYDIKDVLASLLECL